MLKSFLKSERGITVAAWALGLYDRLLRATVRFTVTMHPDAQAVLDGQGPFLGVFWHNRLGLISAAWTPGRPVAMVQSEHGDSRMLGIALRSFVTRAIFGSSRRNPLGAYRGMLGALRDGLPVAITPDGPRGPRMRCQLGVIDAARQAQVPILPVALSTSPRVTAGSWDRFLVPLPFTRGVIVWGAPIHVPRDAKDREPWRLAVEMALNEITESADRAVGAEPIPPEDPRPARRRPEPAP
jgi:lysophospholipid acyltransferase (LPLAT)-like uncharacterized protein